MLTTNAPAEFVTARSVEPVGVKTTTTSAPETGPELSVTEPFKDDLTSTWDTANNETITKLSDKRIFFIKYLSHRY